MLITHLIVNGEEFVIAHTEVCISWRPTWLRCSKYTRRFIVDLSYCMGIECNLRRLQFTEIETICKIERLSFHCKAELYFKTKKRIKHIFEMATKEYNLMWQKRGYH